MVLNNTDEKPLELYNLINTLNPDLKFTMGIANQSICFLDLRISIAGNKLTTTVYSKPKDSHLYLHANSCRKNSSIKGIKKGAALRLRRICKSKEYTKCLVNKRNDSKSVE